jgi:hypothetical protein
MRYTSKLLSAFWLAQAAFFIWGLLQLGKSIGGIGYIAHVGASLLAGSLIISAGASMLFSITLYMNNPRIVFLVIVGVISAYLLSGIFFPYPPLQFLLPRSIMVAREIIWPYLGGVAIFILSIPVTMLLVFSRRNGGDPVKDPVRTTSATP